MTEKIKKQYRIKYLSGIMLTTLAALLVLLVLLHLDKEDVINLPRIIGRNFRSLLLIVGTLFTIALTLRLTLEKFSSFFEGAEERIFYSKIYSWVLYSIGVFVILHHFGVSLGNITLFIGLITTGLAFAVREVLLSIFAWLIMLRKKPFRIGDYIRIGDEEGKVIHIGTFYVLLDDTSQLPENYIRIPNRLVLEKSIINLGKNTYHEEITFPCNKIPKAKDQLLQELKKDLEGVVENRENFLIYFDIRKERLVLALEYLVRFHQRQQTRSAVIEVVYGHLAPYLALPD